VGGEFFVDEEFALGDEFDLGFAGAVGVDDAFGFSPFEPGIALAPDEEDGGGDFLVNGAEIFDDDIPVEVFDERELAVEVGAIGL